ncbi:hypothetical protein DDE74_35600 [Streptomyces lydicus]|uniref:Hydrolase n=1 Tax=Streptomyces lydicus TaxID=47763 RepID=A0A3S9YKX0_9ACTN|nr:hypothetical protein DDE74_35600 [Streptomyces lydicus]
MSTSPASPVTSVPPAPVIFDLDGTLVDSEPNYYEAGRRLLADHGVPGFSWEHHTRFIGIGTRETLETLRREFGLNAPVEELLASKNRAYLELARAHTPAFARAGLLFKGGQGEFTAQAAYDWLRRGGTAAVEERPGRGGRAGN